MNAVFSEKTELLQSHTRPTYLCAAMCARAAKIVYAVLTLVLLAGATNIFAAEQQPPQQELFEMSLQQLMNIEVSLTSRNEQKLFQTPAAVYVITAEDITRSGATSIPDLLRIVPGLEVARINSNRWAISARGFNNQFANKLLVLLDGRSIYTPHFAGVYWDSYDVMLEDVERIEIIRGPGGALWGTNAVNGIINIVTKNAADSQGTLLTGGAGNVEKGFGAARYGGKVDDKTYFRVYSKYFSRDDKPCPDHDHTGGHGCNDDWDVLRGGFRVDSSTDNDSQWTLLGDIYNGNVGNPGTIYALTAPLAQTFEDDTAIDGGDILARWKQTFSPDSDMQLQLYYDRQRRLEKQFDETLNSYDVDFEHRFAPTDGHEIMWGLGYRLYRHTLNGTFDYSLDPRHRDLNIYSGFFQDRIELVKDKLRLTVGTKIEHNPFTGFEFQPGGRLLWTVDARNVAWAAVTRAVRTPSLHERDSATSWGTFQAGPFVISQEAYGNDDVESEEVVTYELGYRTRPGERLLLDVTGFVNVYDNLKAAERLADIPMPGYIIWPYSYDNNLYGESYGAEVWAGYQAAENWRLSAGYSFLQMQLHARSSSTSTGDADTQGKSPHNQFHLRSYLDLTDKLQLDMLLYYVDNLPTSDIHSYVRLDARLGWQITDELELSVVGQNLLDNRHTEFGEEEGQFATEVERAVFVKLTYRF